MRINLKGGKDFLSRVYDLVDEIENKDEKTEDENTNQED